MGKHYENREQHVLLTRIKSESIKGKGWEIGKYSASLLGVSAGLSGVLGVVETTENQPRAWVSSAGLLAISGICHVIERRKASGLIEDEHRLLLMDPEAKW